MSKEAAYVPETSDILDDELLSNVEAIETDFHNHQQGATKRKVMGDAHFERFKVPGTDNKMDEYSKKRYSWLLTYLLNNVVSVFIVVIA